MRKAIFSVLTILLFILTSQFVYAVQKEVDLAWDHDGVDLAGFKIYYGPTSGIASGTYANEVDVSLATACPAPEEVSYCHTLTLDIPENQLSTIYFGATAYDDGSNESGFSNEAIAVLDFEQPPAVTDLAASYDKFTNILTLSWTYEDPWLPKITHWSLWTGDVSGGPYTKVVDIPYDPNASPPYTTAVEIPVPGNQEIVKYYVLVTHRGSDNNNAYSGNSNEVSVTIDKMPPKSPFEFRIKIR